jgi:hypothetical protein
MTKKKTYLKWNRIVVSFKFSEGIILKHITPTVEIKTAAIIRKRLRSILLNLPILDKGKITVKMPK